MEESPYNIVLIYRAFPFGNLHDGAALVPNMAWGQQGIVHSCLCIDSLKSDGVMTEGGLHGF